MRKYENFCKALRNLAAHAYQEQTAMEVVEQTRTVYLALFHQLKDSIEANWMA